MRPKYFHEIIGVLYKNIGVSDENIRVLHENIRVSDENIGVSYEAPGGVSDEMGSPMGLRWNGVSDGSPMIMISSRTRVRGVGGLHWPPPYSFRKLHQKN